MCSLNAILADGRENRPNINPVPSATSIKPTMASSDATIFVVTVAGTMFP